MDEVDDSLQDAGVGVGVDAVAEVEDVAGVLGPVGVLVVPQHVLGALDRRSETREHECRIEVALHDEVVAESASGVGDPCAPVQTDHRRAGAVHRLQEMVAADAEVDAGGVRVPAAQLAEHVAGMGEHVAVVVASAQRPGPGVEQLERGGTMGELGIDERDRRLGEAFHHVVPEHLVGVDERLGVPVVLAGPTLDQVARNGERCPGEGEEWDLELGDQPFDGRDDVVDVVELEGPEAFDVVAASQRLGRHRSGARRHVDAEPDGVRCHDDVAEQHRGVDAVAADGLQGDLGGELGLLDGVEDRYPLRGSGGTRAASAPPAA